MRKVMEGAEIAHDRLIEPPQPVVATVRVKIRSKIRSNRQLHTTRRLQSGPTQGPFGRNMNNIWALHGPSTHQEAFGRQAHPQLAVPRDLDAMHQEFINRQPAIRRANLIDLMGLMGLLTNPLMTLTGPDQADLVLARMQSPNEFSERHRHTVDFGRVGLGDKGDPKRPLG